MRGQRAARRVPNDPAAGLARRAAGSSRGFTLAKLTEPPYEAEPHLEVPTPRWTWTLSTTLAKSPKFEK